MTKSIFQLVTLTVNKRSKQKLNGDPNNQNIDYNLLQWEAAMQSCLAKHKDMDNHAAHEYSNTSVD